MQELESWYLGDPQALEQAGLLKIGQGRVIAAKRKYRNPENLNNAKQEFQRLVKQKGQLSLARQIAPHLDLSRNSSVSFKHFVEALKWAAQ